MKKVLYRWFRLEFKDTDGKWKDAGDVYEEETRRACRGEMVFVNFAGHTVRMVEFVTIRKGVVSQKHFRMK